MIVSMNSVLGMVICKSFTSSLRPRWKFIIEPASFSPISALTKQMSAEADLFPGLRIYNLLIVVEKLSGSPKTALNLVRKALNLLREVRCLPTRG
mgnify:CR=1 FL=1